MAKSKKRKIAKSTKTNHSKMAKLESMKLNKF